MECSSIASSSDMCMYANKLGMKGESLPLCAVALPHGSTVLVEREVSPSLSPRCQLSPAGEPGSVLARCLQSEHRFPYQGTLSKGTVITSNILITFPIRSGYLELQRISRTLRDLTLLAVINPFPFDSNQSPGSF